MDIGPTEPPLQPVLPSEGIRRVEGRSDARDLPRRRQGQEEQSEEDNGEPKQDSVDVSQTYLQAHSEHASTPTLDDTPSNLGTPGLFPQLDIEA